MFIHRFFFLFNSVLMYRLCWISMCRPDCPWTQKISVWLSLLNAETVGVCNTPDSSYCLFVTIVTKENILYYDTAIEFIFHVVRHWSSHFIRKHSSLEWICKMKIWQKTYCHLCISLLYYIWYIYIDICMCRALIFKNWNLKNIYTFEKCKKWD